MPLINKLLKTKIDAENVSQTNLYKKLVLSGLEKFLFS